MEIECFYRCSPNTAHWQGPFPSSLNHLPICSDYCDAWYEACAPDMTCAANWITDWNYTNGNNYCKPGAQCSSFDQVYNVTFSNVLFNIFYALNICKIAFEVMRVSIWPSYHKLMLIQQHFPCLHDWSKYIIL